MDYPSIRKEDLPYHSKKSTWNLLHAYIDEILIQDYPGDEVQTISRLQSQCAKMTFSDQIRYNRLFRKVIYKGGESEINYIKTFKNAKDLEISVGNSYSQDQLMHTFLDNFQKDVNTHGFIQ